MRRRRPAQHRLVLVAAVADNDVIGRDGPTAVAAQIRDETVPRRHLGKPVVMGRKTYLSFGKPPLPGRTNIVVSRDPSFHRRGRGGGAEPRAALEVARGDALRRGVADRGDRAAPISTRRRCRAPTGW